MGDHPPKLPIGKKCVRSHHSRTVLNNCVLIEKKGTQKAEHNQVQNIDSNRKIDIDDELNR